MPKRIDAYVKDYVVFDLETTGVSTKRDKIIEVSALKVKDGWIVDEFSSLVNPERNIPKSATNVNRITNDMVADAPKINEVLPKFLIFASSNILLGQNIQRFDLKMIYRDCEQLGLQVPGNDFVDTLPISKQLVPQLAHHSLKDLANFYRVSYQGAHRALTDCHITHQVYQSMRYKPRPLPPTIPVCPKCSQPMVLRASQYGPFWGCKQYPNCNGTRNISDMRRN